jgi:photosystem II stability/assembly factor-like uncharacterized protein
MFRLAILALLCALAPAGAQTQRWKVQYFYDQAKSVLDFADIQFLSPERGIAVGVIREGTRHKNVAVTTNNGGAEWVQSPLEEEPISLFFLNDSLGWLVTDKGIFATNEGGRDWHKIGKTPAPALRVYFWDENHGIAACLKKKVAETFDGGKKWTAIEEASKPPGAADRSAYNWIAFATPRYGLITGFNQPLMRWGPEFPTWLDPEDALSRRETAHLGYTLSTTDGGKTWVAGAQSILGQVTRVRLRPDGTGLGLVEHMDSFRYPSEVYQLDWKTGKNQTVFRDKRYALTDVWLAPDGTSYLGGIELQGKVRSVMPGRVRVFRSTDLKAWSEMKVDYRANAQRVVFAGYGAGLWLATDTGMILKLQ